MSQRPLARAIGLALLMSAAQAHGGDRSDEGVDAGPELDLAGLVASDVSFGAEDVYVNEDEDDLAGECPGPSGCVADVRVLQLLSGETSGLPMETSTAWVQVINDPFSGIPAENAEAQIEVWPGYELEAQGCISKEVPNQLVCEIGQLEIGERWSKLIRVTQVSTEETLTPFQVRISTSSPDPNLGNNVRELLLDHRLSAFPFARITDIDATNCPAVIAEVSLTDALGHAQPGPVPVPGSGVFMDVFDDGQWLGSPTVVDVGVDQASMVFVVDNSEALDGKEFELYKNMVADVALNWYADAQSKTSPAPALAVTGSSGAGLGAAIQFSQTAADFLGQLELLGQSSAPTSLFDRLDEAASALNKRAGSTAIVALMLAGDAQSEQIVDPAPRLREAGVPVYPIVSSSALEPIARRIAEASGGFRRVVFDGVPQALDDVVDAARYASRLAWNAPLGGQSVRDVSIRRFGFAPGFSADGTYSQVGAACSPVCHVHRGLPDLAAPIWTSHEVTLSIDPQGSTLHFALVEIIPEGWFVNNISHGGLFDEDIGQIRWEGKAIDAPTQFSYQIIRYLPPPGFSWQREYLRFSGMLAVDSTVWPVCGDTELATEAFHPLDAEGSRTLNLFYLSTYEESWLHGKPWLRGISPIPASHLTRAVQIVSEGSSYQFNMAAPLPWVSQFANPPPYIASAQRQAQKVYEPGQPFQVELLVTPQAGTYAGAIEEVPPGGWQIVSIGDDGVFDPVSRTIRWGLFHDDQPRMVSYELLPPADASGSVRFLGRYSVDGEQVDFGGTVVVGNEFKDLIFGNGFD